jgi:hypothetical protein
MAIRYRRSFRSGCVMLTAPAHRLRRLRLRLVALRIHGSVLVPFAAIGFATCLGAPALHAQDVTLDRITAMADTEALRSIEVALIAARAMNGTTAQYLAQIQPGAPLDLRILRPNVPAAISRRIRLFYLTAVGKQEQIDVVARESAFAACRPACTAARRDSLVGALDVARSLVARIQALANVSIIAAWPGGWAIDSLMYESSGYRVRMHSPILAIVPWRELPVQNDAATTFLQTIGTSVDQMTATAATMRSHGLATVIRGYTGDVRVVLTGGLGPSVAGLLFLAPGNSAPKVEDVTRIGDIYAVVTLVAPHVYYYETR